MKHWIERIADELNEMDVEKHVIASGTSISEILVTYSLQMLLEKHCVNWEMMPKPSGLQMTMTHLEKFLSHFLNLMTNTLVCHTL